MSHPYKSAPPYARWSRAVAAPNPVDVDPVATFPFVISRTDRIVTAGSCFAQHIARYLSQSGFNHFIAEPGHPALPPEVRSAHNYGLYSARYGNVYTSRQLLQLLRRAYGEFEPRESIWTSGDRFVDPFRPTVQPGGFLSARELRADRKQHLRAVRRAVEAMDVFVFTLGLTETWASRRDGAVFPLCPGVDGGEFAADRHVFVNLSVDEVVADMAASIALIRKRNPACRVILTVSPVPLAATALDRHVLVSTTLSKAALRVAADRLTTEVPDVTYFPSYEIITGSFSRGAYFASDLRSVTDAGVAHVMKLFFRHATDSVEPAVTVTSKPRNDVERAMEAVTEALCEEALLDA